MSIKLNDWIEVKWYIEDVREARRMSPSLKKLKLSDADCRAILARVRVCHDANLGINWEVLQSHIEEYCRVRDAVRGVKR
jgi:DNA-binding FrmR family transcriptional regulator